MRIWNALIVGIGGTGVITLKRILEYAALKDPKVGKLIGAEKHGLAQREGSVDVHVRFLILDENETKDETFLSAPTIPIGDADIAIGIEPVELLRDSKFTSDKTTFVINTYTMPPPSVISELNIYPSLENIVDALKDISGSNDFLIIDSTKIAIEKMGDALFGNNILLGAALATGKIPLDKELIEQVLTEQVKQAEKNIEALNLGFKRGLNLYKK
ncbi:MAG: 2-oxoacid:acceptor oxidoreductase family protein [Candidatus Helarchaeota archaeon]